MRSPQHANQKGAKRDNIPELTTILVILHVACTLAAFVTRLIHEPRPVGAAASRFVTQITGEEEKRE
ncbi:hypothetical protein BSK71_11105 [Pectobacterium actinidiae]|uniref:Uncharacterized protein n=1 Tax=Pectobacterium actinidiae TaxID=1507808 RepID=A0A1V2R376_9GAMM|nr:hypothetical protein BSK69_11010 [Pectobacterium actinidiae]ONK05920.1 hypothetical protein BSK71_11105 [Pectobacterium actinidiae]